MVAQRARPPKRSKKRNTPAISAAQRRALFRLSYLRHHNATQAALDAGYSPRTAASQGSRMLRHVEIKAALQAQLADYDVTAQRVTRELAYLGFANVQDFVHADGRVKAIHELTREQAAAVRKLKVTRRTETDDDEATVTDSTELELADKRPALELLGRTLHLFDEDSDANRPSTFVLVINAPRSREERERQRLEAIRREHSPEAD